MNSALFFIGFGTLCLAAGGLMTTYGWNLRSSIRNREAMIAARQTEIQDARNAMLHSLASEIVINLKVLNDPMFTEENDEKLKNIVVYPRARTEALAAALASNLFTAESDRELFTRINVVHGVLSDFNYRLNISQIQMVSKPAEVAEWRRAIKKENPSGILKAKVAELGSHLLQAYKIDPNSTFFVDLAK